MKRVQSSASETPLRKHISIRRVLFVTRYGYPVEVAGQLLIAAAASPQPLIRGQAGEGPT
ncbi:hypothetical protein D3C77_623850 [compost metagenome]